MPERTRRRLTLMEGVLIVMWVELIGMWTWWIGDAMGNGLPSPWMLLLYVPWTAFVVAVIRRLHGLVQRGGDD